MMNSKLSRRSFVKGAALGTAAMGVAANCGAAMADEATPAMVPGKYTAAVMTGYWGIWKLPVTITVNEYAILKIETPEDRFEHGETEVILQAVKDLMFDRIIENQSLAVDGITGATISSACVRMCIEADLVQAYMAAGLTEAQAQDVIDDRFWGPVANNATPEPIELDTDILVVGMGTGGIVASLRAAETIQSFNPAKNNGDLVSILAIEKAGKVGGRSALTHEFNAVNPPVYCQVMNNGEPFTDPAKYYNDFIEFGKTADGSQSVKIEALDLFFAESGNAIDWLYNRGWRFGTMNTSAATGEIVVFNSVICSNKDTGTYEDRRGKVNQYYQMLLASFYAAGGKLMLETEGYEYIVEDGAVRGVKARSMVNGQEYIIHAKAVIAGGGGYADSPELLCEIPRDIYKGPRKTVTTGTADGKMLKAALNIGAAGYNLDMSPMVMHLSLDHWLTKYPINFKENNLNGRTGRAGTWTLNDIPLGLGISANTVAMNKQGKRFDSEAFLLRFADDVYKESWCAYQSGNYYYSLWSKEQLDTVAAEGLNNIPRWEGYCAQGGVPANMPLPEIYECLDQAVVEGMAFKGDTLEELCANLPDPVDPAVLRQTIEDYNSFVDAGEDVEYHKDAKYLNAKINLDGPFYVVQVWNAIFSTCGGLDVDNQIRVLDKNGDPIPGLYSIGCDSLGVMMNGERNYIGFSGVAQGWYLTSGYVAGKTAAEYVKDNFGFTYVSPALVQTDSKIA